ncbi:MAG: glycosyltransferase [Candidatus Delongbacteria bacterium]|nr:glycosyltransferase [Candidatus Delongbacteria bacterium]
MKILHITNAYPTKNYSSFGIFIKEQIDSINSNGYENDVYFINAWEKGKIEYLRNIFKIRKIAKDYEIVHCHHIYSGLVFLLAFTRKKFVLSLLGDINSGGKLLDKLLLKIVKPFSDIIIYKNANKSWINDKKMLYCPNGVNLDLFYPLDRTSSREKLSLVVNKKYALFVSADGKKNKIKRYDKFVRVIELLNSKDIEIEPLILYGVERSKVPFYYSSSDIMILTSDHEGSPNAVKEAMACNIPVVSTNVGNVADMLSGCNGSFVSKNNSPEDIAELAERSLNTKEYNSRDQLITKELDMLSVAGKIKKIYTRILE